eukprot:Opistho-2@25108
MDMNNGTMDMNMGGGMVMTFWWGTDVSILFDGWHPRNTGAYVGSVFGVFFIAVLYEFFLAALERVDKATRGDGSKAEMSPLLKDSEGRPSSLKIRLVRSLLHMVQVFWAYFLMLVFMTYNGGLCISVILGTGFGYLVSGRGQLVSADASYCH